MYRFFSSFRRCQFSLLTLAAILSICFVVTLSFAQSSDPSSKPSGRGRFHPEGRPGPNEFGMGIVVPRFNRWIPKPDEPISAKEWQEVVDLMTAHSPARMELFRKVEQRSGQDSEPVRILKRRAVGLHRMIKETRERDPRTCEFALQQIKIEDEIIAVLAELRTGETPERRQKLNDAIRKFIDNNFAEREAWLKRLEESIAREREKLIADHARVDELVRSRAEFFEHEFDRIIGRLDGDEPEREPKRGDQ